MEGGTMTVTASGLVAVGSIAAAVLVEDRRLDLLTVSAIAVVATVVVSGVDIRGALSELSSTLVQASPLATVLISTAALVTLTATLAFADHGRVYIAGGLITYPIALIAGEGLVALFISVGLLNEASVTTGRLAPRSGLAMFYGLGLLCLVGWTVFTAHSFWTEPGQTAPDGEEADLSPEMAGSNRLGQDGRSRP
jgi:hypothetical protein